MNNIKIMISNLFSNAYLQCNSDKSGKLKNNEITCSKDKDLINNQWIIEAIF